MDCESHAPRGLHPTDSDIFNIEDLKEAGLVHAEARRSRIRQEGSFGEWSTSPAVRRREFALQAIRWNAEVWAELPSAGRGSGPPVPPAVRRLPMFRIGKPPRKRTTERDGAPKDITLYGGASGGSTFCAPGDCKRQACKVEVDANPHPLTVQVWCMVDNVGGQRWCIFHTYKRENQRHDARLRIAEAKAVAGAGSGQGGEWAGAGVGRGRWTTCPQHIARFK
jgi:hypothetical protein